MDGDQNLKATKAPYILISSITERVDKHTQNTTESSTEVQACHSVRMHQRARCFMRLLTVRSPAYTLPGGDPRISDTIASLATLMF